MNVCILLKTLRFFASCGLLSFCFLLSSHLFAGNIFVEFSNEDMGLLGEIPRGLRGSSEEVDGNFTQGFFLSYSSQLKKERFFYSIFIEQDLFTPSGEKKELPFATDGARAFASYTGLGGRFVMKSSALLQSVTLFVGALGAASGGAQMQNFFHKTFKKKEGYPGWEDQIEGGALFHAQYNLTVKEAFFCEYLCLEVAPSLGFSFGTLKTGVSYGGGLRIGSKLKEDFETHHHSALSREPSSLYSSGFSWNLFVRYFFLEFFHNELLQGKTRVSKSRTVSPYASTREAQFGFLLRFSSFSTQLQFVMRSKEYEEHEPYEFIRFGMGFEV